jgi:predicted secreted protein
MSRLVARFSRFPARTAAVVGVWLLATLAGSDPAGARSSDGPPRLPVEEIDVHWEDNGAAYHVPAGSKFFIALPASPASIGAWRWLRRATDPEVVTLLQRPGFLARPEGAADEMEGFQVFAFQAVDAGRTVVELRFKPRQPSEDEEPTTGADRFTITIDVP